MCSNGEIWAAGPDGHVFHRTDVSRYQITGNEWMTVSEQGTMRQLSCGRYGQVWGVTPQKDVLVRSGVTATTTSGSGWTTVGDQKMSYVSIGHDGHIWSIGADGRTVYYRQGVAKNNLNGDSWQEVQGEFFMVEVGDCQVYGISVDHTIFRRINVNPQDKMGSNWVQV
jgi:hypothetical protein